MGLARADAREARSIQVSAAMTYINDWRGLAVGVRNPDVYASEVSRLDVHVEVLLTVLARDEHPLAPSRGRTPRRGGLL